MKQVSPPEPLSKKDSKKEKEKKKEGIFKGLFKSKKKDKKSKDEIEQFDEKASTDYSPQSPVVSPLTSGRNSPGQEATTVMSAMDSRAIEVQIMPVSEDKSQDETEEQPRSIVAELEGSEAAHEMESSEPLPINTALANEEKPRQIEGQPIVTNHQSSKTG